VGGLVLSLLRVLILKGIGVFMGVVVCLLDFYGVDRQLFLRF
jgi:hypothetical protein